MNNLLMFPKRVANAATIPAVRASALKESDSGMEGIYRQYTILLLRRYFRLSVDMGRLPSVLGREFFRAKVTSYKMHTFEDAVVFVHDMERCVEKLTEEDKRLLAGIVLMDYSQSEIAKLLGISRGAIARRYHSMLDRLTGLLVETGVIDQKDLRRRRGQRQTASVVTIGPKKPCASQTCQEGDMHATGACISNESK